jgi:hypothetical protein
MKAPLLLSLVLAGELNMSSAVVGESLSLNQLPAAAQQKVNVVRGTAGILSIQSTLWDGKTIYDVRLNQSGPTNHLYVTESGTLVNWQTLAARLPLAGATNVSFGQLPMPVLSAIQSYAGTAFISKVEKGELQGRTIYQASFTFKGRPVNLRVLEDGSLVSDQANDLFVAQYRSDLGLPPTAGLTTAPTGESQSGGTGNVASH